MREWRKEKISEGYGKAIYARRAQRFRNEEKLRRSLEALLRYFESQDFALTDSMRRKVIRFIGRTLEKAPPAEGPINYMPKEGDDRT